jgi:hypothetical protein
MSRQLESYGINILQLHVEWLVANGYKREATSGKRQIRMILNSKKKNKKLQASSLTGPVGDDRMNLERNNYGKNNYRLQSIRTYEKNSRRSGRDP